MLEALKRLVSRKPRTGPEEKVKPTGKAIHSCIDRQGNYVPIARMSDNYLLNTMKFTRRKVKHLASVIHALETEAVARGLNFTKEEI